MMLLLLLLLLCLTCSVDAVVAAPAAAGAACKSSVIQGIKASLSLTSMLVATTSRSDFRDRYPFITSKDFLVYMKEGRRGDPDDAISRYNRFAEEYPMYKLSELKMALLLDRLKRSSAASAGEGYSILEVGSFYGYSALNLALSMPSDATLTIIEANPESCDVIREVLDHALRGGKREEVKGRIKIINGISSKVIRGDELGRQKFDFVFLDHDKSSYLQDLLLLQERGLVGEGTIVAADNVIFPGAPDFLARVTGAADRYETSIVSVPFERIGFETGFREVADGMSFTKVLQ